MHKCSFIIFFNLWYLNSFLWMENQQMDNVKWIELLLVKFELKTCVSLKTLIP